MNNEAPPADEFEEGFPFDLEEARARREKYVQEIRDIDTKISDRNMTDLHGKRLTDREFWQLRQQLLKTKRDKEREIMKLNGWIRRETNEQHDQTIDAIPDKLRDDFAKAALRWVDPDLTVEDAAKKAYELADAMLVERERKEESGS